MCRRTPLRTSSSCKSSLFPINYICTPRTDTQASYDKLMVVETLRDSPHFRYCIAPNCPSGQLHDPSSNIFICGACNGRHCSVHNVPFHDGETCAQFDERTHAAQLAAAKDAKASQQELDKTSVKCPGRDCGVNIHKTIGCDHMTCKFMAGCVTGRRLAT
jgi:hypothetical protein